MAGLKERGQDITPFLEPVTAWAAPLFLLLRGNW
jgi:hypothetical protein